MRMSCNGCRILRKGCSENCSIKPCLDWIKSPDSQSNATLFLSKFYGRTGFVNLINAGPEHLRPAIFRSLLYEACGRIVNPVYGSVGLLWTGNWQRCQAAVEAVLKGSPITQISSSKLAFKASDIRHVSMNINSAGFPNRLFKKPKSKAQFKRSAGKAKPKFGLVTELSVDGPSSQEGVSWLPWFVGDGGEGDSPSSKSVDIDERVDKSGVGELDLTLGLNIS